jgi:hypothetical protein
MNDDFLTRFRKPPRREFAAALYQRINAPMNTQNNFRVRRFTFAAAIGVALIAALAFSPAARAAFNGLIRQIGGITYLEPEESQPPLPESEITIVPEEMLSLEQARTRVPFDIQLPSWTPEGYTLSPSVRVTYFPHETLGTNPFVYITWLKSQEVGGLTLIELVMAQRVSWVVDMDHLEEVQINGRSAGLTGGTWNADTGAWDTSMGDLTLTWMHNDAMYMLRSPGASVEELIRMAESIP